MLLSDSGKDSVCKKKKISVKCYLERNNLKKKTFVLGVKLLDLTVLFL